MQNLGWAWLAGKDEEKEELNNGLLLFPAESVTVLIL